MEKGKANMRMKKTLSIGLVSLLLLSIATVMVPLSVSADEHPAQAIWVDPGSYLTAPELDNLTECDTFTVDIMINVTDPDPLNSPPDGLFGFDYHFKWDATSINLTSYTIHIPPEWTSYFKAADKVEDYNATHKVHWLGVAALFPSTVFTGVMSICTYTFHVIYQPHYPEPDYIGTLDLQDTKLADDMGDPIVCTTYDGQYRIPRPPIYSLEITTEGGGTTDPTPGTYIYEANSTVQVTAIPDVCRRLDHWELDGFNVGSANPYSVLMNRNHTLHAVFTGINYALTITTTAGGTTSPSPGAHVYPCSTNVSVTAIPYPCYQFDHWELDGSPAGSANPITVHMDANHNLHAVFTKIYYTLTITTTAGGTTSPSPGAHVYPCSTDVSVTAIPDVCRRFDHWELDEVNVGSANPYSVHIDGNHTLHAVFVAGIHDVAITNVTSSKTIVGQGYSTSIKVTVENQGDCPETFNVTTYYDDTPIETKTVTNMPPGQETNISFTWNTTGVPYGIYTISANVTIVPGETDTDDNSYTDGTVRVSIPGDIKSEFGIVDIYDLVYVAARYGAERGEPPPPNTQPYEPNADINCDGIIDIYDVVIIGAHYGETW